MKKPSMLVKTATAASSMLLVGAFLSYRAGAFHGMLGEAAAPTTPSFIGGSKSKVFLDAVTPKAPAPPSPSEQTPGFEPTDPVFMSSSKSLILVDPAAQKKATASKPSPSQPSTQTP